MTVLTFTAGLSFVHSFGVDCFPERFLIRNLRLTDGRFDLEFSEQSVDDYFKVKFAHSGDYRLSRFFIGIEFESGIFLGEFKKSERHFFLTCFRLRLDGYLNNRFGEFHLFKDYRMIFIAERVARRGFFKSYDSADISGINLVDFLSVVSVHKKKSSDSFLFAFRSVVYVRACG